MKLKNLLEAGGSKLSVDLDVDEARNRFGEILRAVEGSSFDLSKYASDLLALYLGTLKTRQVGRFIREFVVSKSGGTLASTDPALFTHDGELNVSELGLDSLKGLKADASGVSFDCSGNELTSLEGCPTHVGRNFNCSSNLLTSLEGCPEIVDGDFLCNHNKLTSLESIHKHLKKLGGGIFEARGNPIKSHVLGLFMVDGCDEVELDNEVVQRILNKHLPEGRAGLTAAQNELIEAGLEEFAQI